LFGTVIAPIYLFGFSMLEPIGEMELEHGPKTYFKRY